MKNLDLNNSYIYLSPKEENCWRTNIKSYLEDLSTDTKYFLTKECRAESIGKNPFIHSSKTEFCVVLNNKKNKWFIRNIPLFKRNEFGKFYYQQETSEDEMKFNYVNLKKIDMFKVIEKLESRNLQEIYSKFHYEYQQISYSITTKVEYINFGGTKNLDLKYVQPIFGYVPFIKDKKIYLAYIVKYLDEKNEGDLEVRLRSNQNLSIYLNFTDNFLMNTIKRFISFLFGKVKISEFSERITIKKSKLEFFEIEN